MLPSVWPRGFLATQVYLPKCGSPARLIVSFISTWERCHTLDTEQTLDSRHLVDGRALLLGVGVVLVSVDHGAVLLPVVQAGVECRYTLVDDMDEVHLVGWASTKQVRVTVSPW